MRLIILCSFIFFVLGNSSIETQKLYELEIEKQVNEFRAKYKKNNLNADECLQKAAKMHADYLITEKVLSHFQKNKDLKTPIDRVNKFNCKYEIILENVAYFEFNDFPNAKDGAKNLVDLWIKSKGHKDNMINKFVNQFGTSVAIDWDKKKVIAVQVFSKSL